mmetsp:Transcript_5527/g.15639  ORF Transcript_5527/g.15639 Transcript_5527/m.15639 type:complete len:287 (+) Transcript_5527:2326-3186(+)
MSTDSAFSGVQSPLSRPPSAASSSISASATVGAAPKTLEIMYPVDGWTMPAVPPTPIVRWGRLGSILPIGMQQYSSSSTDSTSRPRCFIRASKRAFSSGNGMMGRATRLVSSKNTLVSENGIAYRNVGSFEFDSLSSGSLSRWSSLQSMNSILSTGNGCDLTVTVIPYAPWYPGSYFAVLYLISALEWPVASMTNVPVTLLPSEQMTMLLSFVKLSQLATFASWNWTPAWMHRSKSFRFSFGRSTRAYGLVSVRSSSLFNQTVADSQTVSKQSFSPMDSNSSIQTP